MGESPQTCLAAANQSISNAFSKTGTGARHTCQLGLLGSGLAREGLGRVNFLSLAWQESTSRLKGLLGQAPGRQRHSQKRREGRHRALWTKRLSEGRFSQADLGGE